MKKYLYILVFATLIASTTSCNIDFFPSDAMTSGQIAQEPTGVDYLTTGIYGLYKYNRYYREWFQFAEFRGDNAVISGRSTNEFFQAYTFTDTPVLAKVENIWTYPYKVIYLANSVINALETAGDSSHILGENYFFRGISSLHLMNLFAKPYSFGRENPGIPLRVGIDSYNAETTRATVGEVYDQIVKDLLKAIELLDEESPRGANAAYVTKASAQGILTRVYLEMGEHDKVISLASEMLGADPSSKLDHNYKDYFANTQTSHETLWCLGFQLRDTPGTGGVGSMYIKDGIGWGEIYPADPLVKLFMRYPDDLRWTTMYYYSVNNIPEGAMMARFPQDSDGISLNRSEALNDIEWDAAIGKYKITAPGRTPETPGFPPVGTVVETKTVNTYPVNYIVMDGREIEVIVSVKSENRNSYPLIYNKKFSYQDGDPMLCSPVMIRWAEVILNRAEARAKTGDITGALADVNVIRARAGLTGDAQFTEANITERGYADILDVVLDERRMEFSWEGIRTFDLVRNKRPIDRHYASMAPWEIVQADDNKVLFRIPQTEVDEGVVQNP